MDEVGADEKLRAAIGKSADGVGFPDFLEEAFAHVLEPPWFAAGRENGYAREKCQSRMHDRTIIPPPGSPEILIQAG